jgi:hypothetical protein
MGCQDVKLQALESCSWHFSARSIQEETTAADHGSTDEPQELQLKHLRGLAGGGMRGDGLVSGRGDKCN